MGSIFKLSFLLVFLCFIGSSFAQNTQQDYLAVHNAARSQVGVAPISWDGNLASYASNYAIRVRRANTCHLLPSSGGPYGENLARWNGGAYTGRQAVSSWVAERPYYTYRTNSCARGRTCDHYTQVVWRSSVRVGCARVQCTSGWWFVICSYSPRGNIPGRLPY